MSTLPTKGLLPLWVSSEAVGGPTPCPGELEWDPNADTTSSGALGRAFKGALENQGNSVAWCSGVLCGIVMPQHLLQWDSLRGRKLWLILINV